jgi:hypothetical protein
MSLTSFSDLLAVLYAPSLSLIFFSSLIHHLPPFTPISAPLTYCISRQFRSWRRIGVNGLPDIFRASANTRDQGQEGGRM